MWTRPESSMPSTSRSMSGPSRPWTGRSQQGTSRPTTGQTRPWTASRPATARPITAASTRHDGSYIIALLEGRGVAREVGMAALDRDAGRVMLVQVRAALPPLLWEGFDHVGSAC